MINKILIRTSDRKTLHKDRRSLGMNGENLQEVLLFCLDEKIEGIGIVEVELPDGTKGMIEVDRTEEGYELPVKSSLLTQTGFVKFQLRILHDDVEIFKSEIIALEVKDSINATETIPEQYPTWIDNLTTLKQELEKAESERVSNENERQSAEKTRQENFTKMQETVSNAVSNIKDLTEEYNSNAKKETKKFNDNAVDQTKTFNDNSDSKLAEYNKNHTDKIKEYDDNAKAKLDEYNENDADKTNAYNDNTVLKEKAFNDIVTESTEAFNTNVEQKETEFEDLAEEKINEYNQVSAELTAKVEQVQAENEFLKAENKLIKEQIPSATASGNNINIKDSGSLDFDWKIKGGHKQATREGYNLLDLTSLIGKTETKNGITYKINEDCSITLNGTATEYTSFSLLDVSLKAGEYLFTDDKKGKTDNLGRHYFLQLIGGSNPSSLNGTLTINDTADYVLYMVTEINQNLNNVTLYPMIHEGTEDKPYEQYGASPSPDYPSEVETVGSNVNYFDKDNQDMFLNGLVPNNSGSIEKINTDTTKTNYIVTIIIPCEPNQEYTVSRYLGGKTFYLYESDKKDLVVGDKITLLKAIGDLGVIKQTITTTSTAKYIALKIYDTYATEPNTYNDLISSVKIEKGSVVTPYSPYGMGNVEIDVVNKNLFPSVKSQSVESNGITLSYNADTQEFRAQGTATNVHGFYCTLQWKEMKNLKADKNYTMSITNKTPKNCAVQLLKLRNGFNVNIAGTNTASRMERLDKFKPDAIMFYATDIEVGTQIDYTFKVQIEEGTTATNIVGHQSQTAIMPIQQELLENDYIADVEHHEIGTYIFTGEETVSVLDNARFYVTSPNLKAGLTAKPSLCNVSTYGSWANSGKKFNVSRNSCYFTIDNFDFSTAEEMKVYLKTQYEAGTPVKIYYPLAEPVDLELTDEQKAVREQKLYTYKNVTNISVSDELASIDVEYKKDPTTEHDDLQNQIDEIKQLLSTTQTSALLLDNLQKDVEMEV